MAAVEKVHGKHAKEYEKVLKVRLPRTACHFARPRSNG